MGWYDHDDGMGAWGWLATSIGVVAMVLLLGLLILGGVLLARAARPPAQAPAARPSAEQLLAERFARGEIDQDRFLQDLAALRGTSTPPAPR